MASQKTRSGEIEKAKPLADAKAERLAAALRANLKRRKAQARDRAEREQEPGADGPAKAR